MKSRLHDSRAIVDVCANVSIVNSRREFDKAASRQVQQMFDEIDTELYEGRGSGEGILQGLQDECQEWTTRFPHLRIVGTQLLCPTDEGFQWYATPGTVSPASSPSTGRKSAVKCQGKEKGGAELNIQGRKAGLIKFSSSAFDGLPNNTSSSYDQSRVIDVEGHLLRLIILNICAWSRMSVRLTDQALVLSLPANLVFAEPWSRVLPCCPAHCSQLAAETLLPGTYCPLFKA
ncbi:hypothetical protein GOODEAATRI_014042 [Goodea atripinnis]|uniref:DUF3719 domain-containing protein n=1 Tax=Goodea atripinnis TaxID=208336 RepID=A0ABV0MS06_9TELE